VFAGNVSIDGSAFAPRLPGVEATVEQPLLLTLAETARLLRIGKTSVYEMAADGRLPTIRYGRMIRVNRAALLSQIEAGTRYDASDGTTSTATTTASRHGQRVAAPRRAVGGSVARPIRRLGGTPLGSGVCPLRV